MNADDLIDLIDPRAVERARRVAYAIALINAGRRPTEVRHLVRVRYSVNRMSAWNIVQMAIAMADLEE